MDVVQRYKNFIQRATGIHGNKYDYSKVVYKNNKTKVCIICPKHGEFWQIPSAHLGGQGCPKCCTHHKLSIATFIKKAKSIHGDKYDYSKVNYVNAHTKICIICPKHGEFWQIPNDHLNGCGCPDCGKDARNKKNSLTAEKFIKKAEIEYDNFYNYSKSVFINSQTPIIITCPLHGDFTQTPYKHLQGYKCPLCTKENKKKGAQFNSKKFIEHAKKKYAGNGYDYSKVEYVDKNTKICIICPKHGEFYEFPHMFLKGHGCPKCKIDDIKDKELFANKQFIEKAAEKHNHKYDYSKSAYKNNKTKICIICPKHGEFWQKPNDHLNGHGCPECAKEYKAAKRSMGKSEFIKRAQKEHGDKYDYSKVVYKNNSTKVCIICPIHGEFWQKPNSHLSGEGCPKCRMSHLERETTNVLNKYHINYEVQKRFDWLISNRGYRMPLDFFLPNYNVAIECQGEQHYFYMKRGYFTKDIVDKIKQRDKLKRELCETNGIHVHYIKYDEDVSANINNLLNTLMGCKNDN